RPPPFIFTKTQAKSLIKLASELPEVGRYLKLRGPTYQIVFILLYGLGLRVSEVCRIQFKDVDQDRHLLVIQQTKFAKNRLVPFGPRIGRVLTEFISLRQSNSINNHAPSDPIFSFTNNRPISRKTVGTVFRSLIFQLNIQPQPGSSSPRVHSLRHSFAVGRLLQWYHEGINPASRLLHLSTFLGHVSPESTAVYLTITGDLLEEAGKRFESFAYNTQEGASQ
ncbi:MAG: integrase, partial [Deltaproteobacteria bacterium]